MRDADTTAELVRLLALATDQRESAWRDVREFQTMCINKDVAIDRAEKKVAEFKNFHRLLCERFGYSHDPENWQRDQLSLIEHIASLSTSYGHHALGCKAGFDWYREAEKSKCTCGLSSAIRTSDDHAPKDGG